MSKTGTVIAADTRKKAPGNEVRVMLVLSVECQPADEDTKSGISVSTKGSPREFPCVRYE